ncbi:MAG: tyrosine-type recombinase/integrase [Dehalococcoidia bacterium]|nr:MAG: tyrosine-type recombinase/integrase [Dehalococcoidia bacterium]
MHLQHPLLRDDDPVFSNPDGSPIHPDSVTWAFRQFAKAAGLPTMRFHDLRHVHATLMLQQVINPKVVSEMSGHSSIGITLDTCSHVLPGMQESAAIQFEKGLQQVQRTSDRLPVT